MARVTLVELPSLVYWRIQRGLTQEQLAKRIAMRRPTVLRIEAGHLTRVRTARLLASALSIPIADLQRRPPDGLPGDQPLNVVPARIQLTVSVDELARVVDALRHVGDQRLVERFALVLRHSRNPD